VRVRVHVHVHVHMQRWLRWCAHRVDSSQLNLPNGNNDWG
jgi:hypothetical protein